MQLNRVDKLLWTFFFIVCSRETARLFTEICREELVIVLLCCNVVDGNAEVVENCYVLLNLILFQHHWVVHLARVV